MAYQVILVVGLFDLLGDLDIKTPRATRIATNMEAANKNAQGPLHVEARTHLQPAVDFFSRAVIAAEGSSSLTGELLSSVRTTSEHYIILLSNQRLRRQKLQ